MGTSAPSGDRAPAIDDDDRLGVLRRSILGFDLDPAETSHLDGAQLATGRPRRRDRFPGLHAELNVLGLFADVASLTRRRPESHELAGEDKQSPEEYLFTYLRATERGVEASLGGSGRAWSVPLPTMA